MHWCAVWLLNSCQRLYAALPPYNLNSQYLVLFLSKNLCCPSIFCYSSPWPHLCPFSFIGNGSSSEIYILLPDLNLPPVPSFLIHATLFFDLSASPDTMFPSQLHSFSCARKQGQSSKFSTALTHLPITPEHTTVHFLHLTLQITPSLLNTPLLASMTYFAGSLHVSPLCVLKFGRPSVLLTIPCSSHSTHFPG